MGSNKYSDWLRIDLHIHTDWSKKTKDDDYKGFFSVSTLISKLKENQVEIFSLTDHNIINVDAYTEYYGNYTDDNPLLLLGVELDIQGTSKIYHSLLVFNYTTTEKAKDLGKKLEDKYLGKGITIEKERVLTIEEVIELFPEDEFFFIPHSGNTKSIVDGHKVDIQDAQKMVLLMESAFEKVKEKARQKYNEGFDKVLNEAFQNKDDIAYIEFSDNHNIQSYPCTHKGDDGTQHGFYYIKGGKNYETLRLAFIDPKSRIKSQIDYDKLDKNLNVIKNLKIEENNFIAKNELSFSPHLNVIIGGRSSGKSLLMYILGKKIDKVKTIDSKYEKVEENKITIKSNLDSEYKEKISTQSNVLYINQGDIVRYFEEKKLYDLADKSNKKEDYDSAKELFKTHKTDLINTIDSLIADYKTLYEIGIIKYELHKSTIDSILSKKYIIKFDFDSLKTKFDNIIAITETDKLIETLKEQITSFKNNKLLNINDDDKIVIESFEKLLNEKKDLIQIKQMQTNKKMKFTNSIDTLFKGINSTLDTESQQKTTSIENLQKLKKDIKIHFSNVSRLKKSAEIVEKFDYSKKELINLNDDVDLVLEVELDGEIKIAILDGLNGVTKTASLFYYLIQLLNNKSTIKNYGGNLPDNLNRKISTQLKQIFESLDKPKDFLEYNETTSKNNSPGFNSEKYLEIILKNTNNKIIFIDQPEDNLGNKFISNDLVTIIRDIKFKKQIFLVTHNPSIVVYGDAENIILATNDSNKITYKQIVLENKDAQKEICGTLDGGEYIFNNRSRKYNIKRILKEDKQHG